MALTVIHVLVPEPPGELGGADMHLLNLAAQQAAMGLRPIIMERGSPEFALCAKREGMEVLSASDLSFRTAIRFLSDRVSILSPDIIHSHGYDADYWSAIAKAFSRTVFRSRPLVFTQHGVVEDTLWHKIKTAADAVCTRFADGVITCADGIVPRMRRWCPNGLVEYIPNGVNAIDTLPAEKARTVLAERFGVPKDVRLVGYIGRLASEKQPARVLSAICRAREAGEKVHLVVAGSGPLRPQLERLADELKISNAVTFAGLVLDIGVIYSGLDVLMLLSDTETTSRVVIEAMSSGVAVVATAVGGTPELLGDGRYGYLVPRGDEKASVIALRRALRSPAEMTHAAQAHARTFYRSELMANRINNFYEALLNRQRGAGQATST